MKIEGVKVGMLVTVPGLVDGVCVVTHVEDWRASVYNAEDRHQYAFNVEALRPAPAEQPAPQDNVECVRRQLELVRRASIEVAIAADPPPGGEQPWHDAYHLHRFRPHHAPVRHNALNRCPRCKGRAYTGLLHVECAEPECVAEETEPALYIDYARHVDRDSGKVVMGEPFVVAYGRGYSTSYPTREGAIAAWKKAVGL